jgi:hypothetical protein
MDSDNILYIDKESWYQFYLKVRDDAISESAMLDIIGLKSVTYNQKNQPYIISIYRKARDMNKFPLQVIDERKWLLAKLKYGL